ncbi:glycosyltransferase [Allokutzneria multivorans]|uniref:Glycosyltransferase n=1 Tax=Allokutzneria multivorans TaxID=1142134 RepID=A0ABP7T8L4_9PSEU
MLSLPAHGHVHPTLAVAEELVRRGHKVTYATGLDFTGAAKTCGATPLAYSPDLVDAISAPGGDRNTERVTLGALRFTERGLAHLAALHEPLDAAPPQLIAYDPAASVMARLLARRWGVPTIALHPNFAFTEGFDWPGELLARYFGGPEWQEVGASIGAMLAQHGAGPADLTVPGEPAIVFAPRSLQPHASLFGPEFTFVGPSTSGSLFADDWTPPTHGKPVVLISLGTYFNDRPEFLSSCVDAFGDQPWHVVLTLGGCTSPLPPFPSNFEVHQWVPQLAVLRHASLLLTNGGIGVVQAAILSEVPVLIAPEGHEHHMVAEQVVAQGLGATVSPSSLRSAASAITASDSVRERLHAMSQQMRAAGGTTAAADTIESHLGGVIA